MKIPLYKKITSVFVTIAVALASIGVGGLAQPTTTHAQGVVDFVSRGAQVLDGCENITGSKYEAIASELGIDIQGGLQGGLGALGDELKGSGLESAGKAVLGGLQDIGGQLANSAIGDAVSGVASSIGDAIGPALSGIAGIALPGIGSVLGGVVGGLFGGGGPEEVVEKGLRKVVQQGQKIALYEQQKITQKERCLDALAQKAGQKALRDLTQQSVGWLQDGFTRFDREGNPGFVEDLNQFLSGVSDDTYQGYLSDAEGSGAGSFSGTCNFLRRPILESVTQNYIEESDPAGPDDITGEVNPSSDGGCELTSDNLSEGQAQAFLSGDFSAGGWEAFSTITNDPGSSPTGAYLEQRDEVDQRISSAKEQEKEQLQWGQGFLADNSGGFTPASVVQGITQRLFTSDIERLELIDEMGEVAGNLGKTLIGKISGAGSGDSDSTPDVGLSNLDEGETVGGDQGDSYEFLAQSLTEDVVEQIEIERNIQNLLVEILPLYGQGEVDTLIANARSCLEAGNLTDTNADVLLGNLTNNLDIFRNTVIQNRTKIDWKGDPLSWVPVIKEETQKPIGWTGSDYDWSNDGVDRYYNQGTAEGCENGEDDGGNASYVIRQEVIPDPEEDFSGVFLSLPADMVGVSAAAQFDRSNQTTLDNISADEIFGTEAVVEDNGGVYTVWEKQICGDSDDSKNNAGLAWNESPLNIDQSDGDDDDYADTPRGQQRAANAQCNLATGYDYCLTPAYRAPQIISGDIYKENSDGVVEPSECNTRSDAGTHYFVSGGEETWSTRECKVRKSPQGSAVEWESGFPDSAGSTDQPVYTQSTSTNPVQDQAELVEELEGLLDRLESDNNDFFAIQAEFYTLQDRFNGQNTTNTLRQETRKYIENVRNLNELVLESENCSAGNTGLSNFGQEFLDNTEDVTEEDDGETSAASIETFSANRVGSRGIITINWLANNADSCTAISDPVNDSWNDEVDTSGTQTLRAEEGVTLTLSCESPGGTDQAREQILPVPQNDDEGLREQRLQ